MGAQPTLGVDPGAVHAVPEFELGTLATGLADPSKQYRYCKHDPNAGASLAIGGAVNPAAAATACTVGHHDSPWTVRVRTATDKVAGVPANAEVVPAGSYFWVQVGGVVNITTAITATDVGIEVLTDQFLVVPGATLS